MHIRKAGVDPCIYARLVSTLAYTQGWCRPLRRCGSIRCRYQLGQCIWHDVADLVTKGMPLSTNPNTLARGGWLQCHPQSLQQNEPSILKKFKKSLTQKIEILVLKMLGSSVGSFCGYQCTRKKIPRSSVRSIRRYHCIRTCAMRLLTNVMSRLENAFWTCSRDITERPQWGRRIHVSQQ